MSAEKVDRAESLSDWLAHLYACLKEEPEIKFKLSPSDVLLCARALRAYRSTIEERTRTNRAILAFREAPRGQRFEAYARERGFNPPQEALRARAPVSEREVVTTYLTARYGKGTKIFESSTAQLANPDREPRSWDLPSPPRTSKQALEVTSEIFDFPSVEACRQYLARAEKKIKSDPTGWRADVDRDFKLPWGE